MFSVISSTHNFSVREYLLGSVSENETHSVVVPVKSLWMRAAAKCPKYKGKNTGDGKRAVEIKDEGDREGSLLLWKGWGEEVEKEEEEEGERR